ncbi:copper chaperone PCu(A)C [Citromicrobium bathyomarinum]|uniref:copper chaperone PCu(A)C n=1 Tax=Citromicrobium bathyomarinum TaxID=72174 RepID=UPI001E2933F3|nr:copper chaperone PCu(A)C [Citromicrobium bathyomarinum]
MMHATLNNRQARLLMRIRWLAWGAIAILIAADFAARADRHPCRRGLRLHTQYGDYLMTIRIILAATALAGSVLLSACNSAPETEAPTEAETATSQIAITGQWSRETAFGQDAGGAFMTINNSGTGADRLTGGSTPVAGEVQVHTVDMTDGVMRMRQLEDGLEVPAGGSVTLKPGSFHIMLMQLSQPLGQGETVPLTFNFEKAGPVEVELVVEPVGSQGPDAAGGSND